MDIIQFKPPREEKYPDEMTGEELLEYLSRLERRLADLDAREPKNMNSDAFEAWADEHEALEDAIDEVREFLDEL